MLYISELMSRLDTVKTELPDADYLFLVNKLASVKKEVEAYQRRIRKLKRQAFRFHLQLGAVTDFCMDREYSSDSDDSTLLYIDSF